MGFAILLLLFVLISAFFAVPYFGASKEERFEKINHELLMSYQNKIRNLQTVINDRYSNLSQKQQCVKEVISCYEEIKAICFQSDSGKAWYQSACEAPATVAREALVEFEREAAGLKGRKREIIQILGKDDWRTHWDSDIHDAEDQEARIRRGYEEEIQIEAYNPGALLALVRGVSGNHYFTTFRECSCPDFKKRGLPCKHIYCLCKHTATPGFSAPLKIPKRGLYGMTVCISGKFNLGTQEEVRYLLTRHLATVPSSIGTADILLTGGKSTTERAVRMGIRLGLMIVDEEELVPMLADQ